LALFLLYLGKFWKEGGVEFAGGGYKGKETGPERRVIAHIFFYRARAVEDSGCLLVIIHGV
jgi:hypothetical protein